MNWFLSLLLLVSTSAFAQKADQVVATVGTKKITLDEFNRKYKEVLAQTLVNAPSKKLAISINTQVRK